MKILLVSDTHGTKIDLISAYAEEMKADICIHAGDFGFYDKTRRGNKRDTQEY